MHDYLVRRLQVLHRRLEHEVEREQRRRLPDWLRIARLKKLKLAIKDRMARRARVASPA
jgi:hypothetical protein